MYLLYLDCSLTYRPLFSLSSHWGVSGLRADVLTSFECVSLIRGFDCLCQCQSLLPMYPPATQLTCHFTELTLLHHLHNTKSAVFLLLCLPLILYRLHRS